MRSRHLGLTRVPVCVVVCAGNDVLMLMGNDFTYTSAMSWFRNLDRLIHHVNKVGGLGGVL